MLKGHIINELIDERRVKKVDLYTYAGITKSTLDNIIKGINDPKCTTIEKIADFFKMPIDFFFNREIDISNLNIGHQVKGNGNNVSGDTTLSEYQKEIAHLKELLAEKERTIQILMNK